eukprot:2909667-Alexandrium_andersonii.AAC.1
MHCTLTRKGAVVNVINVHVTARADPEDRDKHTQWILHTVNTLGADARVIMVGDWNDLPTECATAVAVHTLGFRLASPDAATRWVGRRCIDWALFRLKYFTMTATLCDEELHISDHHF